MLLSNPKFLRMRFHILLRCIFVLANGILTFPVANSACAQPANVTKQEQMVPDGVRKIADIEYVKEVHPRHRLDLYLPEKSTSPVPVVLWVHGGGWAGGDKAVLCKALSQFQVEQTIKIS